MVYDISLLNENYQGGLTCPLESVVDFCGTCLNVMFRTLEEENVLNEFYSTTTSSREGIKVIEYCIVECYYDPYF